MRQKGATTIFFDSMDKEYLVTANQWNEDEESNVHTKSKTSDAYFQHHRKNYRIDFVLAAKNKHPISDRVIENNHRREKYFQNLKKKHLKISKPLISIVSLIFLGLKDSHYCSDRFRRTSRNARKIFLIKI